MVTDPANLSRTNRNAYTAAWCIARPQATIMDAIDRGKPAANVKVPRARRPASRARWARSTQTLAKGCPGLGDLRRAPIRTRPRGPRHLRDHPGAAASGRDLPVDGAALALQLPDGVRPASRSASASPDSCPQGSERERCSRSAALSRVREDVRGRDHGGVRIWAGHFGACADEVPQRVY